MYRFWTNPSENCPETRDDIANKQQKAKQMSEIPLVKKIKPKLKLFSDSGRPFCINQLKLKFTILDKDNLYEITLFVYK